MKKRGFHAGRLVRQARAFVGMSQRELAARIGADDRRVSKLERRASITTKTLVALGEAMGLELGYRPVKD